jgi:transposase
VAEAPAPPQAVEKSLAGEGLLADVVVTKYVDHTPLHRLSGVFAREGIDLPRSTFA